MTDKVQKIREKVEKRYEYWREKESNSHSIESEIRMSECQHLLLIVNSLQEEPKTDWLQELKERLDSLSKEDFKKVMAKYSRYGEEEPVSEELEEAVNAYIGYAPEVDESSSVYGKRQAFKAGAKWQRQKDEKILTKNNDEYTEGVKGKYITVTK